MHLSFYPYFAKMWKCVQHAFIMKVVHVYSNIVVFSKQMYIQQAVESLHKYWNRVPCFPLCKNWLCIVYLKEKYMLEEYSILLHTNTVFENQIILHENNVKIIKNILDKHNCRLKKEECMIICKLEDTYFFHTHCLGGSSEQSKEETDLFFEPCSEGKSKNVSELLGNVEVLNSVCYKSSFQFLMVEYFHEGLKEPVQIYLRKKHFIVGSRILTPIFIYFYFKYELGEFRTNEIFRETYTLSILDVNMNFVQINNTQSIYIATKEIWEVV